MNSLVNSLQLAADLSDYNAELHRRVLTSPATCMPPFEEALEEFIRNRSPKVGIGRCFIVGLSL